ncbi:hypothetical protein B0H19DRAFT_165281 [Mycena capillaripes]|nr:hypothetical protein B0H19DRAFT_165281 [Mycena capillaripes]
MLYVTNRIRGRSGPLPSLHFLASPIIPDALLTSPRFPTASRCHDALVLRTPYGANPTLPRAQVSSIARPAALDGVRPIIPAPLPLPPSRTIALSADAFIWRCVALPCVDQDRHVALRLPSSTLDPAWMPTCYALKATFPIPVVESRPSSYTSEKADRGGEGDVFESATRAPSGASLRGALSRALCERLAAPVLRRRGSSSHSCTARDRLSALRSHMASIVFNHLLWRRPERNTRERSYRVPRRVLSYRLLLCAQCRAYDTSPPCHTRWHNRYALLYYTSSPAIVRAHTPIPIILTIKRPKHASPTSFRRPPFPCRAYLASAPESSSVCCDQQPRLLPAGTICSTMAARAIRATTWKPLHARYSVCETVRPYSRDSPGAHPRTSPHHQPHA